jgi:hypothetical protein
MANPEHLKLLQQGVEVWNAWMVKERSVPADLANLVGANLITGADLSGAPPATRGAVATLF